MNAPNKIYIQEGAILRTEKTYDNDVCYVRIPEQPVMDCHDFEQGLEEEIDKYFRLWRQGASDEGCVNAESQFLSIYDCQRIARHFAEWGAEHFK